MSTVYIGTNDDKLLLLSINNAQNNNKEVTLQKKLINASNPHNLKSGAPHGLATEWVLLHPHRPCLYAITSYWTTDFATIVTYRVLPNGDVTRLGETSTRGHEATHATFSPDGRFLAVSNLIDARIAIFDCDHDDALADEPVCVVDLPPTDYSLKSLEDFNVFTHKGRMPHSATYTPNGKYLIVCDCGMDQLVVYRTNAQTGCVMIDEKDEPKVVECSTTLTNKTKAHGYLTSLVRRQLGIRPRHVAVHPNGTFLFVLYETANAITWHALNQENGRVSDAIGEISTLGPDLTNSWLVGLTINGASEIQFSEDGSRLYVSNRGLFTFGRKENSVVVFSFNDEEEKAENQVTRLQTVVTNGQPRHFLLCKETDGDYASNSKGMIVGTESGYFYIYDRDDNGLLHLVTETHVGEDSLWCHAIKTTV